MTRPHRQHRGRRGSVYIIILATAMAVAVIGISAIVGVRSQYVTSTTDDSVTKARLYAQSMLDVVLLRLGLEPDWRSDYINDEWTALEQFGEFEFTYKITDKANDNLTDDPLAPVRIHAKASVGNATRHYSVVADVDAKRTALRSFPGSAGFLQDDVVSTKWWAQYFKPALPPDATGWWVTSVELMVEKAAADRGGAIRLYEPLGSNMPSNTLVDEATFDSNAIPDAFAWVEFKLGGGAIQDVDDGLVLAVTTGSTIAPIRLEYQGGGVAEADAGFITGDPGWKTYETDKSLRYRVHGMYTTGLSLVPATWQREID